MPGTNIRLMRPLRAVFLFAPVAQLVEQWTENPRVAGSIPAWCTIYAAQANLGESVGLKNRGVWFKSRGWHQFKEIVLDFLKGLKIVSIALYNHHPAGVTEWLGTSLPS